MLNIDRSFITAVARRLSPLALAVCALAAAPAHAVDYTESGDAGKTLGTAQSTTGAAGALINIFGSLNATNDADLFLINITSPSSFSAMTFNIGGVELDTQLFLFTLAGRPVYTNDDEASGLTVLSALPAGSSLGPLTAGLYYVGISLSGYNPVNLNNQLLFADGLSTDVRGPNSSLQPATLAGFDGDGFSPAGAYDIRFTGAAVAVASVPAVPEPSSMLMLLAGGALMAGQWARRNRKSASASAAQA